MSARENHWRLLTGAGLMAAPPDRLPTAAWYIRVLQGFGAWVASIFLFLALLAVFDWNDSAGPMGVIGAASLFGAYLIVRGTKQDFLYQASLALALAGQLCITLALQPVADTVGIALGVAAVAAVLVVVMDDFAHRFIATLVVSGGLIVAAADLKWGELAAPLLAIPFAVLWGSEPRWGARRSVFEPLALGLGFGLLVVSLVTLRFVAFGGTTADEIANAVRVAVLLASLGYVLHGVLEDTGMSGPRRHASLALAIVAALAIELAVANAATALLVLVAAVRAQRATLAVSALATLLALVSHRYYSLKLTLLVKSLWLIGAGAVLLALFFIARRWWGGARREPVAGRALGTAALGAVASVTACLLLVGFGVWRYESVLANGRVMVLQLAPVDPRSIMQGDYMRLRFAVENDIRAQLGDVERQRGWVVFEQDDAGVARFGAFAESRSGIAANAFAVPYRWRGGRLEMLTDAYFFEEGTAQVYSEARFGAFRVDDGGTVILQSLLDEAQQPLGSQY